MGSSSDGSVLGAIISVILTLVFSAVFYVWLSFALSKVFAKVGVPSWKAWVPLYNYMQLIQVGGYNALWALAFLLPFVNIAGAVFLILAIHNINKRFGLGVSFTIIAWFALPVWASIVGFGSAQWGAAPVQAPGGVAGDGSGQYQARVEGIAPGGYGAVPAPAYPAGGAQAPAPAYPAAPVAPAVPAPAQQVPVVQTSALPVFTPAEQSRVQPAEAVAPQAPVPPAPSSIADAMSVTPTAPPAQVRSIPDETSVPSAGFSAAAAESASASSLSASAPSAGGDPWAPPINSVPGAAASAPVVSAASAVVSPPPVSVKPPVVAPPVELVQAPPVAPVAPPVAPVSAVPTNAEPVQAVPTNAAPTSAVPTNAAPLPAPDFDDTIIAEDLPDFDDTVIVGRKSPVWILEPGGSKAIRITSPVALLGRNPAVNAIFPDAQLVLVPDSSKTMSKNHARIALDDGVWTIYDLGSTNGVVLVSADGEETVLESGASAILTETFKLGELPIRLTPEV